MNDLALEDDAPFQVSAAHCAIEQLGPSLCVRDRGSARGTIVNGRMLGAVSREMLAALHPGENELVLGTPDSPHRFAVTVQVGES
jgi:pSer/pThr/pTyr-binding forkhead associated (FHA) protein